MRLLPEMRSRKVTIENIHAQTVDGVPEEFAGIALSRVNSPDPTREGSLLDSITFPVALEMDMDICRRMAGAVGLEKWADIDFANYSDTFHLSRAACLDLVRWHPAIVADSIRNCVDHLNLFMHEGEYIGAIRNAIILRSLLGAGSPIPCVERLLRQVLFFSENILTNIANNSLGWEISIFRWISGRQNGKR